MLPCAWFDKAPERLINGADKAVLAPRAMLSRLGRDLLGIMKENFGSQGTNMAAVLSFGTPQEPMEDVTSCENALYQNPEWLFYLITDKA